MANMLNGDYRYFWFFLRKSASDFIMTVILHGAGKKGIQRSGFHCCDVSGFCLFQA